MLHYYPQNYYNNLQMFDEMTGISQQALTHDKVHTPRGISMTSRLVQLVFP